MRIPILPETVRLVPAEFKAVDDKGEPTGEIKPGAPVGVFRPVTGLEQAHYIQMSADKGRGEAYAIVAVEKLITFESLLLGEEPGVPFDPANPAHLAALPGSWLIDCGRDLMSRVHLTEKDAGKSPSPSTSD